MAARFHGSDYHKIRRTIIKKLYDYHAFQKGHLLYERVISGIPPHLKGFAKQIVHELVKEGLVLYYGRTKHDDAYQLNIRRLNDIEKIIFYNC